MPEQRFPLQWPESWPRTAPADVRDAPFKVTPDRAREELLVELARLGADDVIISTNLPLRRDGMPMLSRKMPDDQGVAVYFNRKGRRQVLACDRYATIGDNIRAIGKTIEALRGIERWGASDMLDRAFTGFEALPAPDPWWQVLDVAPNASLDAIHAAYRAKAKTMHPNAGGDRPAWDRLSAAFEAAKERVGS